MSPVMAHVLGDCVVVIHFAFIAFVVLGGLFALRRPVAAWFHLPAAVYGAAIEIGRWTCPLTPLENDLWRRAGRAAYSGGFVEQYLLPVLYPAPFPTWASWALAGFVLAANGAIYAVVLVRRRHGVRRGGA
ncbi:MAG: DUF2784 domain-containing protein [Anaeromyxobacteraceae bacterium]